MVTQPLTGASKRVWLCETCPARAPVSLQTVPPSPGIIQIPGCSEEQEILAQPLGAGVEECQQQSQDSGRAVFLLLCTDGLSSMVDPEWSSTGI